MQNIVFNLIIAFVFCVILEILSLNRQTHHSSSSSGDADGSSVVNGEIHSLKFDSIDPIGVFATGTVANEWWMVDLGQRCNLTYVELYPNDRDNYTGKPIGFA